MKYAKYTINTYGIIKKDGHTIFGKDIIKDLNRKSFLEGNKIELEEQVQDTEKALTGAIDCINSLKCCGNCGNDTNGMILPDICSNCERIPYRIKRYVPDRTDNWKQKEPTK